MDIVTFVGNINGAIGEVNRQVAKEYLNEEESSKGYIFDEKEIPKLDQQAAGKFAKLMLNIETRKLFYEYEDRPLTSEESIIKQLQSDLGNVLLESANDKQKIASLESMVGDLLLEMAALKGGNA